MSRGEWVLGRGVFHEPDTAYAQPSLLYLLMAPPCSFSLLQEVAPGAPDLSYFSSFSCGRFH